MPNSLQRDPLPGRSDPSFQSIGVLPGHVNQKKSHRYNFERHIEGCQKACQEKYLSALRKLKRVAISEWLARLIERQIIPTLRKTGFDETLARTLFTVAASAWERMTPVTEREILRNPALIKKMREIRSGILLKEKREKDIQTTISGMNARDVLFAAREQASPEYLFSLVQDVCTSWIILPRVYDHLKKEHSHYFLGYLRYFDKEMNPKFKRILARVITEFMGNYTCLHMDAYQPEDRMKKVLFYGYAVMFWKNLKNPPSGMEDFDLFENYLRWASMFQNRFAPFDLEMARAAERMKEGRERAFPVYNAFGLAQRARPDGAGFLVTLRHGDRGIRAAMRYFGPGESLFKNAPDGGFANSGALIELSGFLREIKERFPSEGPRTQRSMRVFLSKIAAEYESYRTKHAFSTHNTPKELAFVVPRILCMARELKGILG